jgi:hypothetical protein
VTTAVMEAGGSLSDQIGRVAITIGREGGKT